MDRKLMSIGSIFFMCICALFTLSTVYAEEVADDSVTSVHAEALRFAIDKMVAQADKTITQLESSGKSIGELKSIKAELEQIGASVEDDMTRTEFIQYRDAAREVVTKFRNEIKTITTPQERVEVRQATRLTEEELLARKDRLNERIQQHNQDRLDFINKRLEKINETQEIIAERKAQVEEIRAKIMTLNFNKTSFEKLKVQARTRFDEMDQRFEIRQKALENATQRLENRIEAVEERTQNRLERVETRTENAIDRRQNQLQRNSHATSDNATVNTTTANNADADNATVGGEQ